MPIIWPTPEIQERVFKEFHLDEKQVKDAAEKLKQWVTKQPHLPQNQDEEYLKRLFLMSKGRMEIAKSVLDMYYTVRGKIPEAMSDRDPFHSWFKTVSDIVYVVSLPHLTEDLCRVTIVGLLDQNVNANSLDIHDLIKMGFMLQDIRYREDCMVADIVVVDTRGASTALASKFTLPVLKKFKILALEAYKARVKEVHLVNATSLVNSIVTLVMTVVKQKHRQRLVIHKDSKTDGFESLHEYISPKILPKEFGGHAGSIYDLWDDWKKKVLSNREWFLNEGAQATDESKRPGKAIDTSEFFGFEGSFRQLNVD